MNNAINLLPCPMCGCNSITIKNEQPTDNSGGYFIECPDCGTSTSLRYACGDDPMPLLAEQWNRRTSTQHLRQIAEPAQAARTEFEAVSRFMKCEWSLDWDPAGFYDDVKTDAAFTWFEQGYMRAQQAAAPLAAVHPDDAAVDALAVLMKAKLAKQRAKGYGGWNDKTQCPQQRLSDMLRAHVDKGDPVDVANFCAMLSVRGEGIAAAQQAAQPAAPVYSPNNPAPLRREGESIRDYRVRCGWDHHAHPAEGVPAQAVQQSVLKALLNAEAALEVAIARILKSDPGHSISVTSEAKALVAVRAALDASTQPAAQAVQPFGWLITKSKLPGDVEFTQDPARENLARSFGYQTQALYEQPAAQWMDAQQYRLIERGELIEAGDQFLRDDFTWQIDPRGIFVGVPYGAALRPARRALAAQAKQGGAA